MVIRTYHVKQTNNKSQKIQEPQKLSKKVMKKKFRMKVFVKFAKFSFGDSKIMLNFECIKFG